MNNNQTYLDSSLKIKNVYIERCNKESEELLATENDSFMEEKITYFKNNIDEFMYIEWDEFEKIGIDNVCLEMDSVFRTYDVMLGIKKQKKREKDIRAFLTNHLEERENGYQLIFNANEGIWELNFSLDSLAIFDEDWTIHQAYSVIYHFLLELLQALEV